MGPRPVVHLLSGFDGVMRLSPAAMYLDEHLLLRSPRPLPGTALSVKARTDRCVVEWLHPSAPSPLMGGASAAVLGHGDVFSVGICELVVYVEGEGTRWDHPAARVVRGETARRLGQLASLPPTSLEAAASRFLRLPYVTSWWKPEFERLTGFQGFRDGNVPKVRRCAAVVEEAAIALRWNVEIFSLFAGDWVRGREQATLSRAVVFDADLSVLWECTGRLAVIEPATAISPPPTRVRARSDQEERAENDRRLLEALGPERPGTHCAQAGCSRGTIEFSVMCRAHHFEMVTGRACPAGFPP